MREPYVFSMDESPFRPDVPPLERRRRVLEVGADVVTDEMGAVVDFMAEDDVEAVLNDPRFAAVAIPTLHLSEVHDGPLMELWQMLMFAKDGAEHHRIRSVVAREFTPKAIDARRSEIRAIVQGCVEALPTGEVVDLWSRLSLPLSARVSCHVAGIPAADADQAAVWALDLVRAFFPFMSPERKARAERAAVEFMAYMDGLFEAKRAAPTDDPVSRLANGEIGTELTEREAKALGANLVFGGLEANAKGLTTGVFHLLDQGKFTELGQRPDRIASAVLELLRFTPPAQQVARGTPHDLVCQGVALKAGQVVSANLMAACRDPHRHVDPDVIDLDRAATKQLAFGAGEHFCLGSNLAKLTLSAGYEMLSTRFPAARLAGEPTWDYEGFAGVVGLPVVLG